MQTWGSVGVLSFSDGRVEVGNVIVPATLGAMWAVGSESEEVYVFF